MGFKFDEKALINNNIFKYEDKLNSQYSRFLDRTPTYVTYYNINPIESTVDLGFSNVEKILGSNSPIRFNEVKNFPIYGMEAIQLNIDDGEEGLNTSYDGELIILPDTIKPYPDDFFIIEHKGFEFLFRVTNVEYDTIKSNNFYKIGFTVKYTDEEESKKIKKQISTQYTCVVDNIGTEDKCIIEDSELELINTLLRLYSEISERYLLYFYSKKYNSIVFKGKEGLLYDRYVNMFIQKNSILYDKDTHKCIYLSNEDDTDSFALEYDSSIYKAFELKRTKRIRHEMFNTRRIENLYSVFYYYHLENMKSVRFDRGIWEYLDVEFINAVKNNINENNKFSEMESIIIKYMHDGVSSVHNIDFNELEDDSFFEPDWRSFIKIPLLLFSMKKFYKIFVKKQLVN